MPTSDSAPPSWSYRRALKITYAQFLEVVRVYLKSD